MEDLPSLRHTQSVSNIFVSDRFSASSRGGGGGRGGSGILRWKRTFGVLGTPGKSESVWLRCVIHCGSRTMECVFRVFFPSPNPEAKASLRLRLLLAISFGFGGWSGERLRFGISGRNLGFG